MNDIADGIAWIDVSDGGSGYTSKPTVTITGDGTGAATLVALRDGVVIGIRVNANGSGYTTAAVSFSGGGGSGAVATAQIGLPLVNGNKLSVGCDGITTITALGTPNVISPTTIDLPVPANGYVEFISKNNKWNLESKNY